MAAAYKGHLEVVEQLIKKGADVNIRCGGHRTALKAALSGGHIRIVEILLNSGVDIVAGLLTALEWINDYDESSVEKEIRHAEFMASKLVCVAHPGEEDATDNERPTWARFMEIIDRCLGNLRNHREASWQHKTPLALAASEGWRDVVDFILQSETSVKGDKLDLGEPLWIASAEGYRDVVETLLHHGADTTQRRRSHFWLALLGAMARQNNTIVTLLVKWRVGMKNPVNGKSFEGVKSAEFQSSLRFLIQDDPVFNQADQAGHRPKLLEALFGDQRNFAAMLLSHWVDETWHFQESSIDSGESGIDFEESIMDPRQSSPKYPGYWINSSELESCWGKGTALQISSHAGFLFLIEALIRHGVDINRATGVDFGPPLYEAVLQGHAGIAALLIENGAEADIAYGKYENVLAAALETGKEDVINLLTERGLSTLRRQR